MIHYTCHCGTTMKFYDGYIPDKFYCTTCETLYTAEEIINKIDDKNALIRVSRSPEVWSSRVDEQVNFIENVNKHKYEENKNGN